MFAPFYIRSTTTSKTLKVTHIINTKFSKISGTNGGGFDAGTTGFSGYFPFHQHTALVKASGQSAGDFFCIEKSYERKKLTSAKGCYFLGTQQYKAEDGLTVVEFEEPRCNIIGTLDAAVLNNLSPKSSTVSVVDVISSALPGRGSAIRTPQAPPLLSNTPKRLDFKQADVIDNPNLTEEDREGDLTQDQLTIPLIRKRKTDDRQLFHFEVIESQFYGPNVNPKSVKCRFLDKGYKNTSLRVTCHNRTNRQINLHNGSIFGGSLTVQACNYLK